MSTKIELDQGQHEQLPRYLCDRHRTAAAFNPQQACASWISLIKTGNRAIAEDNLELANQSFGTAAEIAHSIISSDINYPGRIYAAERLLIATHNLSVTLAKQNRHPLAAELLIRIHRELLVICDDESLRADTRATALSCLTPSLERIRPFLERSRNQETAQQLILLTTTACSRGKTDICH